MFVRNQRRRWRKVGVWGDISGYRTTIPRRYSENMNGAVDCTVLGKDLKQSIEKLSSKDQIIYHQQDRAPWHISKIVHEKINVELCIRLVESMPESVGKCLKAKGGDFCMK